jgi:cation diffusion facilitator family transporter
LERLVRPTPVIADVVAGLALVGIIGNGLSAWLLHKDSGHNLNARAAFLHMIGDLLTSAAVLIGALSMRLWPLPWLDPLLSLAIVAYILINGIHLLKEAVHVLLNGTPKGLDLEAVRAEVEAIDGVEGLHYLHAWSIGDASVALTAHVVVPDQPISATGQLRHGIERVLLEKFGIDHPVLVFETCTCGQGALVCQMACRWEGQCKH